MTTMKLHKYLCAIFYLMFTVLLALSLYPVKVKLVAISSLGLFVLQILSIRMLIKSKRENGLMWGVGLVLGFVLIYPFFLFTNKSAKSVSRA